MEPTGDEGNRSKRELLHVFDGDRILALHLHGRAPPRRLWWLSRRATSLSLVIEGLGKGWHLALAGELDQRCRILIEEAVSTLSRSDPSPA